MPFLIVSAIDNKTILSASLPASDPVWMSERLWSMRDKGPVCACGKLKFEWKEVNCRAIMSGKESVYAITLHSCVIAYQTNRAEDPKPILVDALR